MSNSHFFGIFLFGLILSITPITVFAETDSEKSWHYGEGMKTGDYYEYDVCYDKCSEKYLLKLWISSEKESYWNVKLEIKDKLPATYYKLEKSTYMTRLDIIDSPDDANLNQAYSNGLNNFRGWIQGEKKFSDEFWGKAGNIGAKQLIRDTIGKYNVKAGSFPTTIALKWDEGFLVIADNFPYPIKARVDYKTSDGVYYSQALEIELVKYQTGVQIDDPEAPPAIDKPESDSIPPEILIPSDITKSINNPDGLEVEYSVKAIDNVDQILIPTCDPPSGSVFPVGQTTVHCSVSDSYGNTSDKSFLVTILQENFTVPTWVKNVSGYWCREEIEDTAFIQAIQYLIKTDVIVIPNTNSTLSEPQPIPTWIKNTACWWSSDTITDGDFIKGIEYLVKKGIIHIQ